VHTASSDNFENAKKISAKSLGPRPSDLF